MVTVNEALIREILDRLIRLEAEVAANNRRLDDTNERITETNGRIDKTNERIDRTNTRLDNQALENRREFNKLLYLILGTGAAIIATVLATNLFG